MYTRTCARPFYISCYRGWCLFLLRMAIFFFNTDFTDWTELCPMAIKEIKKFIAFPGLMPLQPDAHAQPCKRASLSDPPHPSGLSTGRRESIKTKWLPLAVQNEPPAEATDGYFRPARSLHQAKDIVVAPGEPIFYCHRQLFCFLGA